MSRIVELYNYEEMQQMLQVYENKPYLIIPDVEKRHIYIALEKRCDPLEVLHSYVHGVMIAMATSFYNDIPLVGLSYLYLNIPPTMDRVVYKNSLYNRMQCYIILKLMKLVLIVYYFGLKYWIVHL